MSEPEQETVAQRLIGDFAPKLAELTDEVLFGDVWARPELSPRDRSLVTVAVLVAGGNTEQLAGHLNRALENGLTEAELAEVITHLAFYAGWPRAINPLRNSNGGCRRQDEFSGWVAQTTERYQASALSLRKLCRPEITKKVSS